MVYVPRHAQEKLTHPWARAIGREAFERLCAAFGGTRVNLPRGAGLANRKRRIIELAEEGVSRRETALRLGVTIRHVRRTLQGLGLDSHHGPAARAARERA
jgi:DNA-binding CsgD family transcriptional regulator